MRPIPLHSKLLCTPVGAVLVGCTFAVAASAQAEMYSSQLTFVPYSSSYLPVRFGSLVRDGVYRRLSPPDTLDDRFSEDLQSSRSVLSRFDEARAKVLGVQDNLATRFSAHFYKPEASAWVGYCNQWGVASLNPKISSFIQQTEGLVCDNVFLSKGELKELFTAFYVYEEQNGVIGGRTPNQGHTPEWTGIAVSMGIDDLPAHEFHTQLYEHLKRNEGIVVDWDWGPEVWNQPVYHATSRTEPVSSSELAHYAAQTPLKWLISSDPELARLLTQVQALDDVIYAALLGKSSGQAYFSAIEPFLSWFEKMTGAAPSYDDLANRRNKVTEEEIRKGLRSGNIKLRPGISVQKVHTGILFAQEDAFGQHNYIVPGSKEYDYLLFIENNTAVDSRWLGGYDHYLDGIHTLAKVNRPDFLWTRPIIDVEDPATRAQPVLFRDALYDLFQLTRKCTDLREVDRFFHLLHQTRAHAKLTEAERSAIIHAGRRVAHVVSRDQVAKTLSILQIDLTMEEIFATMAR